MAEFDPYTYPGSPNVEVRDGILVILASVGLFSIFNFLAYKYGPPPTVTGDIWRWRNTFVSWIHAVIIGLCVLYWYEIRLLFNFKSGIQSATFKPLLK